MTSSVSKLYLFNDEDALADELDFDTEEPCDDEDKVFCKHCKQYVYLYTVGPAEYCDFCGKLYC